MKPATARHRVDTTAKALRAEAQRLGVSCADLGGAIDAVLWIGSVVRLVDFKTPGGSLTDAQAKLVASGCPIAFVSTEEQMRALVSAMRKDAITNRVSNWTT